jgi:hypothetical protein
MNLTLIKSKKDIMIMIPIFIKYTFIRSKNIQFGMNWGYVDVRRGLGLD